MKTINFLSAGAIVMAMLSSVSCSEKISGNDNGENTENTTVMEASGTWKAGTTVNVDRHVLVPEGKSLTIEEGVNVIISDNGVGINHTPIEFTVNGNLYCYGTEDKPVLFSVEESLRTSENTFAGLWGGIVAGEKCEEVLLDHTIIEYTGGQVIEGSPAATAGIYTAGDDAYPHLTTANANGRYVITNSTLRNGWSDGIYLMGGQAIIANNTFAATGETGAEAVNVKAGTKTDVAGNIMFSPNTNGLKLSSSGQSETRPQALVNAYNNTIINAGWRRDGEKGGSIFVEKNALVNIFNNLMVNCKFRAMTPKYTDPNKPDAGYDNQSFIDYNFYASGNVKSSVIQSDIEYPYQGYNYGHKDYNPDVDTHGIIATSENCGELDPLFENYPIDSDPASYKYGNSWDFHLKSGSPALSGAYAENGKAPFFATTGIEINGHTYKSPAVAAHFGAFGMK